MATSILLVVIVSFVLALIGTLFWKIVGNSENAKRVLKLWLVFCIIGVIIVLFTKFNPLG